MTSVVWEREVHVGLPAGGRHRKNTYATETPVTDGDRAYDDKVFFLSEEGATVVVAAGPEYREVGTNALNEMSLATPAVAGDSLFIRTATKLYRIRQTTGTNGR